MMSVERYRALKPYVEPATSRVDPAIRTRILAGRDITTDAYEAILGKREEAKHLFGHRLDGFDAILTPTCVEAAIPLAEVDETRIVTPYGRFVNFLDLAAVSVPMVAPGLPLGLQIATRCIDDALALQIAEIIAHRSLVGTGYSVREE